MDRIEALQSSPLFSVLEGEDLESLARLFVERSVPSDTVLFQEGDPADALYLLLEGKVKVMLTDEEGREVIVSILQRGECFGEMALLDANGRSAQVMTMAQARLLILPRTDFGDWIGRNPNLAMAIIQQLSRRLRHANHTINNLATQGVQSRVARVLLEAAEPDGDRFVVTDPPTQADIASMVGASRERVNRALRALEEQGALRFEKQRIIILDQP